MPRAWESNAKADLIGNVMEKHQRDFIDFMLECGVLRFGRFTTKSGRQSPYFINTGRYITGSQMRRLGEFYAETLHRVFAHDFDNLFGPAYKGIPLAVTTAMALSGRGHDVTYTFNRKEAKDHGEGGLLVGSQYETPTRVVLIEDVTTAGTSVRESVPLIEKQTGAKVVGLVVSVDRMEKGPAGNNALAELRKEFGIKTAAIVSFTDLVAYLETGAGDAALTRAGIGRAELLEGMEAYRREFGA